MLRPPGLSGDLVVVRAAHFVQQAVAVVVGHEQTPTHWHELVEGFRLPNRDDK
jgi:hypothetical protein